MQRATPRPRRPLGARPEIFGGSGFSFGLVLFLVGLLLRIASLWLAQSPGGSPSSDAAGYEPLAWNLASGHGFSIPAQAGFDATAFRPPVVPWLASLLYRAVGHRYVAALWLQCVIGAFVPLLVARLAGSVFGGSVERWAGWLAAVAPMLVLFSADLSTETTFTAVLLLALLASVEWVKTPRPGRALGVGLLWGLATLTRPSALAMPALVALWAWVPLGLSVAGHDRRRQVALLVLGLALVVAPWTIRNAIALRAFVPVTTDSGVAFLDANNGIVWNDPARRGGEIEAQSFEPYASELGRHSEVETDRIAARLGWEFLAAHASEWPEMALAKLGRFWHFTLANASSRTLPPATSLLGRLEHVVDPLLVWSLLTLPFTVWGLVRIARGSRRWYQFLGPLVILYFMVLAMIYAGSLGTRMPIEPLVVLLLAVGCDDLHRRLRARSHGLKVVPRVS